MAWPNPFRRQDENTRTCWGYTFQISNLHLTSESAEPMKHSYDRLGEQALERLDLICPPPRSALPRNSRKHSERQKGIPNTKEDIKKDIVKEADTESPKRDLYLLLRDNAANDKVLGALWTEVNSVPEWVDWAQISRGQEVFYRYGGPALTGLAFQSLLGGMGANRVVEVLARTGGFSTKVAKGRLWETTQFILQCTNSVPSIQPGGAGFASAIRVRLLHAAVRQRIMKLTNQRPEYYDVKAFGIPINDLDCIATISTFSATLIWLSLPRQGIWMRKQETVDFIALFRYVAYLTGTPTEFFATPEQARAVMESLMLNEINPSQTSKVLASNVISCLAAQPPSYASRSLLEATSRWLNGNELCDALGLGHPTLYYWALMAGQCLFFMSICYIYRAIPLLDRKKIAALRKLFWLIIVEGKHGLQEESTFDFKYIPDLHKTMELEEPQKTGIKQAGIERRNFQALTVGCGILCVATYAGFKIVCGLVGY